MGTVRRAFAATAIAAGVVGLLASQGGGGVTLAAEQKSTSAAPASVPADKLVDRLVDLEAELATLPPDDVILTQDATWGDFPGDFSGARVQLDAVASDARDLFAAADDSDGPAAAAVADVARSLLTLREGYGLLGEWETADLEFPLEGSSDQGTAIDADERYGKAEAGLRLVLEARERSAPAYDVLRNAAAADEDDRAFFELRYQAAQGFENALRARLHRALSLPTTEELLVVDRFVSLAPGVEPRAESFAMTCVERDLEPADQQADETVVDADDEVADAAAPDCVELESGAEVQLSGR